MLAMAQIALLTTMLAYQAWLMCDAIGRTLWRVFVTRRSMLEWVPADLLGEIRNSLAGFYSRMFRGVLLALGWVCDSGWRCGTLPHVAMPFLMLWLAAPRRGLAHQPDAAGRRQVRTVGRRAARPAARSRGAPGASSRPSSRPRTITLPPDNFQEDPRAVVAHRTSPTNIGLYLLSIVAARDFGWCGLRDALDRIEATLDTMARMERLHGHLYNWYDTRDLRPLEPRYVSSVDSAISRRT